MSDFTRPLAFEHAVEAGRVKTKANKTRNLHAKAARVARGSPEVMVKITGFTKGGGHLKAHIAYISRHAKLELETDRGEVLDTRESIQQLAAQWKESFGTHTRRASQRDAMSLMLSMPEGTPEEGVRSAARAFARATFPNRDWVYALHTDQAHPHVHLTVKMKGRDGQRLNPRKADLQDWRETFAAELRAQGIDAEATPRKARGVVRKPEKAVLRHIEHGDNTHAPRVPRIRAEQVRQAADQLIAGQQGRAPTPEPWREPIQAARQATAQAWTTLAATLTAQTRNPKTPDHEPADPERIRAGQRWAAQQWTAQRWTAVPQPRPVAAGPEGPTQASTRLRNLPGLHVVPQRPAAQVLLPAHARAGLGRPTTADLQLRRPRTRAATDAELAEQSRRHLGRRDENPSPQDLARAIQQFVARMPEASTRADQLAAELARRFARPLEQQKLPEPKRDGAER